VGQEEGQRGSMRVPEGVLSEISDKINIAEVVGQYVTLRSQGNRLVGLCPFHAEKTPSFTVTPDKGLFYCFGCHKGGNVFTFVMEIEKVPFVDAVTLLAERAGVRIDLQGTSEADLRQNALRELYDRVAGSFTYILNETSMGEAARSYLSRRGITDATRDAFRLGYAPADRGWLYGFLRKHSYSEEFLRSSGMFSSRYPQIALYWNRLMFPISNQTGSIVAFGGRTLSEGGPKYINSPETDIFRKGENLFGIDKALPEIRREGVFLIVEGYMDVLAMHQAGIPNTIAPLGTAFTEAQARRLRRYVERGVLIFDGDSAGVAATLKSVIVCERVGLRSEVVELPGGSDPAEILQNEGPDALHKLVKCPINSFDYLVRKALDRHTGATPEGKEAVIRELYPYLDSIDSEVRKEAYIARLADALGADPRGVVRDFSRLGQGNKGQVADIHSSGEAPVSQDLYLLFAVAVNRELFPLVRSRLSIDDLEDTRAKELFIALEDCFRKGDESGDCLLSGIEDQELRDRVLEKLSSDEFSTNQEQVVRQSVVAVKRRSLERKRGEIEARLRRATADDEQRELQLDKMFYDSELQKLKVNENDRTAD